MDMSLEHMFHYDTKRCHPELGVPFQLNQTYGTYPRCLHAATHPDIFRCRASGTRLSCQDMLCDQLYDMCRTAG